MQKLFALFEDTAVSILIQFLCLFLSITIVILLVLLATNESHAVLQVEMLIALFDFLVGSHQSYFYYCLGVGSFFPFDYVCLNVMISCRL